MVRTVRVVAALALLAVLLGSSFLSPLQEHAFVAGFAPPIRGLRPVGTDSFKVFFDALLSLPKSIVSFFMEDALAANRFLVTGAPCNTAQINADANCWSLTSGGAGGASIPGTGDAAIINAASGAAGTISMPAQGTVICPGNVNGCAFQVNSWTMTGFTGTITVIGPSDVNKFDEKWIVNSGFVLGGTLTFVGGVLPTSLQVNGGTADFRVGTLNPGATTNIIGLTDTPSIFTGEKTFGTLNIGGLSGTKTVTGDIKADVVSIHDADLTGYTVKARDIIGRAFHMSGFIVTVDVEWLADSGAAVNLTQWVTNDNSVGLENYRWVQDTTPITTIMHFIFDCVTQNTDYVIERNSVVVGSQNSGSSFGCGSLDFPVTSGWGAGDVMTMLSAALFVPPGGVGSAAAIKITPVCGNTAQFSDSNPGGILYQWTFGDGTSQITTSGNVTHVYPAAGTYSGNVTAQYGNGAIQQYTFQATVGGNAALCPLIGFLATFFLDVLAILVLMAFFLLIVFRRSKGRLWRRIAIAVIVASLVILFIAFTVFGRLPFT